MVAQRESGYIALITVLIVGAAATAIAFTVLLVGADSQRYTLVAQQAQQARGLAVACGEEALQQIHDNVAFSATNSTLTLGQGNCTYSVGVASTTVRDITATGNVGNVSKKIQTNATVGATTITVGTWHEVSDTYSTISYVQGNSYNNNATATTIPLQFLGNTTAGNLIVAAVTWDSANTPRTLSCSDNLGDTFATVNVWNDATNTQALGICYAANIAGGNATVTATIGSTSTFRRMIVSEFKGVATSNPLDVSTGVGGATATLVANAVTSGAATTTQDGDLIFGAVQDTNSTTTIAAGTGFTQLGFTNNKDLAAQSMQQSTAGSVASTQTFGATNKYDAGMAAFRAAIQ